MIGRVVHISADLVLLSAFLAGVKRNTGLTPNLDSATNSEDVKYYAGKYLDLGERIFDYSSTYFGSSDYFKRR
ncbi:DEHA2G02244p [Debaryomyces hansenii CBS767]|uniref:DEHA2G02244p n=1 Tax=Debaryomyces hansenii (strain ATCC 36239 / CBS 767 / BCRC 21394 / JCM 1990 / NBRC 0083 / IGC 2968) TaxID=284592 RepID=Q6BJI1_DEBHA|nr:DEHA2G02244p [Debaryomyces hansenii CBS767]CAG90088.1 DEHA2G02244p [Debaryomyces hansenii CBS767]|eukprot:XP_461640.1 DEHA2G02244p [Debaryomyces hansenii CBS767]